MNPMNHDGNRLRFMMKIILKASLGSTDIYQTFMIVPFIIKERDVYKNSEAAYQSAKLWDHDRHYFQKLSGSESKKFIGEILKHPSDNDWRITLYDQSPKEWDKRKYDVMSSVVFDKFLTNKDLRQQLIETGNKHLEELNWWSDVYYGVDSKTGKGENVLGKILMKVRDYWKN